jgi:imidazolonepropionase-like amidohydrolase
MKKNLLLSSFIFIFLVQIIPGCDSGGQGITALINGRIIPADGSIIEQGVVLFKENRITAIGETGKVKIPAGAQIIDVAGKTVLPGLIESNGHVTFDGQYDHGMYWSLNMDSLTAIGKRNLAACLDQGITTLRDTHGPVAPILEIKEAQRKGSWKGARLYACGLILNYGSFNELFESRELLESGIDLALIARAKAALSQATPDVSTGTAIIREYARKGLDFIKISAFSATGEVPPTMPDSSLNQLIHEAHRLGLRTTTHALSASSVRSSIMAGTDAIENPELISATVTDQDSIITPELAKMMAARKVIAVPLIVAFDVYARYISNPDALLEDPSLSKVPRARLSEGVANMKKLLQANPSFGTRFTKRQHLLRKNLKTLIENGVIIAMGTDRGTRMNYFQAANHIREMEIYVELGLTPMQAIESATRHGAELLGKENELGTLKAGKLADIIIVDGNPLEHIRNLADPVMVFKDGIRYK